MLITPNSDHKQVAESVQVEFGDAFSVVYADVYEWMPMAIMVTIELYQRYGRNVSYCLKRKEPKKTTGEEYVGTELEPGMQLLVMGPRPFLATHADDAV